MAGLSDDDRRRKEIAEELRFHIEGRVAELMARGMSEPDARAEAERRFGDIAAAEAGCTEVYEERRREADMRRLLGSVALDFRLAWRGLLRDRGVAAAVVVTLGVALGAVIAMGSVADALLLRPLPYPDADRLVFLWQNDRATGTVRELAGTADFYDFRERTASFRGMSMFVQTSGSLGIDGEARFVSVVEAHHDLFDVLGVTPLVGRGILPDETVPGEDGVILLSEGLWRSAFQADPAVVGRTVSLGERPREIVGVVPDAAARVARQVDVWVPLASTAATATRNPHIAAVVARMAAGSDVAGAQREMASLAVQLEREVPENANRGAFVEPVGAYLRGYVRTTLWAVLAATMVLLLIAAANVAGLLLARAAHRQRLIAVHAALGATPLRTVGRHAAEGVLLSVAAAALGLALAAFGIRVLEAVAPAELLMYDRVVVDARIVAFTVCLTALLAVGIGTIPTRLTLRLDLQRSLGHGAAGGGRPRSAVRDLLVAGQAGLATLLLVGALLLGATVRNLMSEDLGFRTDGLLRVSMVLPDASYPRDFANYPEWTEVLSFEEEVLRAIEEVPGVTSQALMMNHPLDRGFTNSISVEGRTLPDDFGEIRTRMVSPGYFQTAGVDVLEGRSIGDRLGPRDPGEVVVNRTAARLLFPDGDAIGQRIRFWGLDYREVVGVVEDERVDGHRSDAPPAFYTSLLQTPPTGNPIMVLVRTEGDPLQLAPALTGAIRAVDASVPVYDVSTMSATLREVVARERFAGTLFSAFALIALFLASVGTFALLSFAVARRTAEIGVRLALGARPSQIRSKVMAEGLRVVGAGVAVGLVLALVAVRLIESLVYGVSAESPWVYLSAAALLLVAGSFGAAIPALRASSVALTSALRSD